MADSLGIVRFGLLTNGTFDASNGTQVVSAGPTASLAIAPFAVSVSSAGSIYAVQRGIYQGDTNSLALRFPAYDPATNSGTAEGQADWTAGPGDDYCGARGVAVDPTGTYVAACFWGYQDAFGFPLFYNGNIKLLNAVDGTVITNLDLGIAFPTTPGGQVHHQDTDCDWDAVGNLYYLDDWTPCWRAFSPPGANQATTLAVPVVQVTSATPPNLTSISVADGLVTIRFTADASDPVTAFTVLSSSTVTGTYAPVGNATITGSNGSFQATVPVNGPAQFFRIRK